MTRMRMVLLCLAAATAAAAPTTAWAKSDSQVWTTAGLTVKLSEKWRVSEDVVARFSDNRNGLYEIESSTLVGYRIGKSVTLWAGYVHNPQYAGGDFTVTEHRVREQVTLDNVARFGGGKLSARMRLEQRWRDGVDGTGWRARPYAKYSLPLKGKVALNLSNETFVNLNRTAFQRSRGVDRMRNLISISAPVLGRLAGEGGYLNQHGFVRDGPDTTDHVAYFAVSLSI